MIPSLSLRGLGLPVTDPLVVADLAAAVGFRGVHLHLHHTEAAQRTALARLVTAKNLTVTWVYPPGDLFRSARDARGRALDRFVDTAAFAARLGVRVVASWLPARLYTPAGMRTVTTVLYPLVGLTAQAGMVFGLEHITAAPASGRVGPARGIGLAGTLALLEALGATAGLVADTAHLAAAGALADTGAWVERVVDVQLADPPIGGSPVRRGWPGHTDTLDHRLLLADLAEAGYGGPVMVESPVDAGLDARAAATQALTYLRALLDEQPATAAVPGSV